MSDEEFKGKKSLVRLWNATGYARGGSAVVLFGLTSAPAVRGLVLWPRFFWRPA